MKQLYPSTLVVTFSLSGLLYKDEYSWRDVSVGKNINIFPALVVIKEL